MILQYNGVWILPRKICAHTDSNPSNFGFGKACWSPKILGPDSLLIRSAQPRNCI